MNRAARALSRVPHERGVCLVFLVFSADGSAWWMMVFVVIRVALSADEWKKRIAEVLAARLGK